MNKMQRKLRMMLAVIGGQDMTGNTGTFIATATNPVQQFEHGLGRTPIMVVISLNPELYTVDKLKGVITSFAWSSKYLRRTDEDTITTGATFVSSNNINTGVSNNFSVYGVRDTPATYNVTGASYADDSIFQAISPRPGNDKWKPGAEYTWWAF